MVVVVVVVEVVHGGRGGSQDTRVFGRTGAALLGTNPILSGEREKVQAGTTEAAATTALAN